jgi:hypothetical protein
VWDLTIWIAAVDRDGDGDGGGSRDNGDGDDDQMVRMTETVSTVEMVRIIGMDSEGTVSDDD